MRKVFANCMLFLVLTGKSGHGCADVRFTGILQKGNMGAALLLERARGGFPRTGRLT